MILIIMLLIVRGEINITQINQINKFKFTSMVGDTVELWFDIFCSQSRLSLSSLGGTVVEFNFPQNQGPFLRITLNILQLRSEYWVPKLKVNIPCLPSMQCISYTCSIRRVTNGDILNLTKRLNSSKSLQRYHEHRGLCTFCS